MNDLKTRIIYVNALAEFYKLGGELHIGLLRGNQYTCIKTLLISWDHNNFKTPWEKYKYLLDNDRAVLVFDWVLNKTVDMDALTAIIPDDYFGTHNYQGQDDAHIHTINITDLLARIYGEE